MTKPFQPKVVQIDRPDVSLACPYCGKIEEFTFDNPDAESLTYYCSECKALLFATILEQLDES